VLAPLATEESAAAAAGRDRIATELDVVGLLAVELFERTDSG
jgi:phosphoribosylaminoimidazole carboxylase (NCAIR synthetase)